MQVAVTGISVSDPVSKSEFNVLFCSRVLLEGHSNQTGAAWSLSTR